MTGIVVVDRKVYAEVANRMKIIIDWTAGLTGDGEGGIVVSDPINVIGFVYEIERVPGALGDKATNCPTASYNLWIKDPYGYNLFDSALNGSALAAQRDLSNNPMWVDDFMTINITAAGSGKQGRLIIWIDRTRP